MVASRGYAMYREATNDLEIVRPGENTKRTISCGNINRTQLRVHGVEVNGDDIWVIAGPRNSPRPNWKFLYRFSSLAAAGNRAL